ncbi:MAG TPA: hypothetical protein PKD51_12270 [Saprospiraceae bacterium]|nr:hypothetical protein [Saprospiraceae bacterium]HMU05729.1 hypothetical protein [Saprospiraceae bacterium]
MRYIYLFITLFLVSCVSKRLVTIERIELNEEKESVIGLPIYSSKRYLYPVFNDNIFIDTIDEKKVRIEKKRNIYIFNCIGDTDTIIGELKLFPYDFIDYTKDINIETFIDEAILMYRTKRFYRTGNWYFYSNRGKEIIKYDVSVHKLKDSRFK